MKAKELEKLTLCRHCIHREGCGVWDHYYNSDDRDDVVVMLPARQDNITGCYKGSDKADKEKLVWKRHGVAWYSHGMFR